MYLKPSLRFAICFLAGGVFGCGKVADSSSDIALQPSDAGAEASVTDASNCYEPQLGCNGCGPHGVVAIWKPEDLKDCQATFDIDSNDMSADVEIGVVIDCEWSAYSSELDSGLIWEPGPIHQQADSNGTMHSVLTAIVTLPSEACKLAHSNSNARIVVLAGISCPSVLMCGMV